jgi:3-oxoadipate enol-lactonase/4-carboxymuconolactone decarboxylase
MFIHLNGITQHVRQDGPPGAAPLVLLHSLGTSGAIFDPIMPALAARFNVIRPDLRGHGLSAVTPGPYSMSLFAEDLAALFDHFKIGEAHVAGVSIGGLIAQAFATHAPGRVASLILIDTALSIPPPQSWRDRAALVRADGIATIETAVIARWVTEAFLADPQTDGLRAMLRQTAVEGYAASCEAIAAADFTQSSARLAVPTLVVVGAQDQSTPVAAAQALARTIQGASLTIIQDAAHIPTVQQPAAVADAMLNFLCPPVDNDYESGMAVRRAVLGDAHVARAEAAKTIFDSDFQAFITRTAWGGVWTRPGLDRRTRSLLTIAMMASLGHEEELKLHLRATRNTGASPADVTEVLMQVAVYAGIPAANAAFRHAKEILGDTAA